MTQKIVNVSEIEGYLRDIENIANVLPIRAILDKSHSVSGGANTQEAFEEAYCKALHLPKLKFAVDENGQYLDRDSQFCYEIWQSCQAHNDALIAELLEVLQSIADGDIRANIEIAGKCKHGLYAYEHCETCYSEYAQEVIAKHKKGAA